MSYVRLDKCDGPECPACGCQDTQPYERRSRWGRRRIVHQRCNHCGYSWQIGPRWQTPPPSNGKDEQQPEGASIGGAVIYQPVRCPECQSDQTVVTSTRRPVRYHRCKECKHTFKSVERA